MSVSFETQYQIANKIHTNHRRAHMMYTNTFYTVESYRYDKRRKKFVVTWEDGSVTYEPKNHPDFVLPDDNPSEKKKKKTSPCPHWDPCVKEWPRIGNQYQAQIPQVEKMV